MKPASNGCVQSGTVVFFCMAILYLVSFGAPYWMVSTAEHMALDGDHLRNPDPRLVSEPWLSIHFGLWQACEQTKGCYYWPDHDDLPDGLRATQALMTLGLLSLFAAMGAYGWWQLREWEKVPKVLSVTLTLITGIFGELAVIVFGDWYGNHVLLGGWAFWNAALCSTCLILLSLFQICTLSRMKIDRPTNVNVEHSPGNGDEMTSGSSNPGYLNTVPPTAAQTPGAGMPPFGTRYSDQSAFSDASLAGFGLAGKPSNLDGSFGTATTADDGKKPYYFSPSSPQYPSYDTSRPTSASQQQPPQSNFDMRPLSGTGELLPVTSTPVSQQQEPSYPYRYSSSSYNTLPLQSSTQVPQYISQPSYHTSTSRPGSDLIQPPPLPPTHHPVSTDSQPPSLMETQQASSLTKSQPPPVAPKPRGYMAETTSTDV